MQRFALLLSAGLGAGCLHPSCNAQNLLLEKSAVSLANAPNHLFAPAIAENWLVQLEHRQPWELPEFQSSKIFVCRTLKKQRIALGLEQTGTTFWNRQAVEVGYARSINRLFMGSAIGLRRQYTEGLAPTYSQQVRLGMFYQIAKIWRMGILITDLDFGNQGTAASVFPATFSVCWTPTSSWSAEITRTFGTSNARSWSVASSWQHKRLGCLATLQFPHPQWRMLFTYKMGNLLLGMGQESTGFSGYAGTLFLGHAF